jgi:ABC-type antimicrobial peptide transport system permease subunit
VAIVNETLARVSFPDTNPVGGTLGLGPPSNRIEYEIVGVAGDASISSVQRPATPAVYLSRLQRTTESAHFLIRTASDPMSLVPLIRETVSRIDPNVPLIDVRTQAEQIENGFATEALIARVSATFGIVALLLASIGIYGLMSHSVNSRVPEIGMRMALGADAAQVRWMIMRETSTMVLLGLLVGLAGTYAATRLIGSLLYDVEPNDPVAIAAAIALLSGTVVVAAFLPARRAAQVEPIVALRHN